MRVAWIGPMPSEDGGAGGVSNLLLRELNALQIQVDCYVPGHKEALPKNLRKLDYVRFICEPSAWQWNRWYSRIKLMAFVTGQVANLKSENHLARVLLMNHKNKPYDVVYQFSHIEFSTLKHFKKQLPPIVLHPSVHAFGELRSLWRERHISKSCENPFLRMCVWLLLVARVLVQKRHIHYADFVLGLSKNFQKDLNRDYNFPLNRMYVVPNPIDLTRFSMDPKMPRARERMVILFVSRISVRKGVEMIVELSHRLDDLNKHIEIHVIGDRSMWSNYTRLLSKLNPRVAEFVGPVSADDMRQLYRQAGILVQPSHYEPFGLTVGEALASGVPVVASHLVGAAEEVNDVACRTYSDGDIDALESCVRSLISDMEDPDKEKTIRAVARAEAVRLFDVRIIASKLLDSLVSAVVKNESHGSQKQAGDVRHVRIDINPDFDDCVLVHRPE